MLSPRIFKERFYEFPSLCGFAELRVCESHQSSSLNEGRGAKRTIRREKKDAGKPGRWKCRKQLSQSNEKNHVTFLMSKRT